MSAGLAENVLAVRLHGALADEQLLGEYYTRLLARLDSLYALKLPREANGKLYKRELRDEYAARAAAAEIA